jgi:imidazolonepropionase-like amidohydrolase
VLRKLLTAISLLSIATLVRAQVPTTPPKPTLIKAGRILDVRTGRYLAGQGILVENGKIKEVAAFADLQAHLPKDAVTIDLSKGTVLPGLIDSHAHLLMAASAAVNPSNNILDAVAGTSAAQRALLGARMAREDLEGGFTTVRNVGHSGEDGDAALRDAIDAGWVPGPRIQASCRKLTPPGGQAVRLNPAIAKQIIDLEFLPVGSPDEGRRAVRENLLYGADFIKVVADDEPRFVTTEEMKAIVEEAHRSKVKVAVHATTETGIQTSIDAGVDSIEHGDAVTDQMLKQMKDKGIFFDLTETLAGGRLRVLLYRNRLFSRQRTNRSSRNMRNVRTEKLLSACSEFSNPESSSPSGQTCGSTIRARLAARQRRPCSRRCASWECLRWILSVPPHRTRQNYWAGRIESVLLKQVSSPILWRSPAIPCRKSQSLSE